MCLVSALALLLEIPLRRTRNLSLMPSIGCVVLRTLESFTKPRYALIVLSRTSISIYLKDPFSNDIQSFASYFCGRQIQKWKLCL